jgi:hypothetical protein
MVAALGLGVSGTVSAQELQPTPTVMGSLGETSTMRLGVSLAPMPTGTLKGKIGAGAETSESSAFAFAIAPTFDFSFSQFFFAGLAPQYILNVKGKDDDKAGSELDLRVRVGGNAKVADTLMLYGYLAPGYSIVMLPDPEAGGAKLDNPAGFVLGFAAGAMLDFTPELFGTGELGYQVGYQKTTFAGMDVDVKTNFLHIGIGLGYRL